MDTGKAVHLFNLAHYGAFNPFSSRHALVSDEYAYENGLNLPAAYSHCDHCGIYQVAGLTSSLRIVYSKEKNSKVKNSGKSGLAKTSGSAKTPGLARGPRQRSLHVRCLACQFVKVHNSLITKKSTPSSGSNTPEPGAKTNAKKKKKKRSELSSLLEEKKKMSASSNSLSLMQFMQ